MSLNTSVTEQIKNYQAMLAADPASKAFAPLAELYRKAGKLQEAIALCQQGLSKNPDHSGAHLLLAQLYIDSKQLPLAEKTLLTILRRLPNHLLGHQMLLKLYQTLKRDDAAKAIQARLQKLTAIANQQRAAAQLPTVTMAKLYEEQGHLDKALAIYQQLVASQPNLQSQVERLNLKMSSLKKIEVLQKWLQEIQAKASEVRS